MIHVRRITTVGLLVFVAASVVTLVVQEVAAPTEEPAPATSEGPAAGPERVVFFYFHGDVRCSTCRKFEAYSREALAEGFEKEIADGSLEWRMVNTDQPRNAHFVEEYHLITRAIVLARIRDGKRVTWKRLDDIWKLVDDREAFLSYIRDETRGFLGSG